MRIAGRKSSAFVFFFSLVGLSYLVFIFATPPSNDRPWSLDQKILPLVHRDKNLVTIQNIRNISYQTPTHYDLNYYDKTIDLNRIKRVWYMVEKLPPWSGMAHTLLSFEFDGPDFVAISVETRKERGEKYSVIKGLFRQYELMYVIADENDVIRLRTNTRQHDVYLYPMVASKDLVRDLFVSMIERAQTLQEKPEFYNSLTNTCTTNLVRHVRHLAPKSIPRSLKVLMPGFSDQLAYESGLIDTSLSFDQTQDRHYISKKARAVKEDQSFSLAIRQ